MDTNNEESRLKKIIHDTEKLKYEYTSILQQCTTLLQTNCFLHKEALRQNLIVLSNLQSHFNDVAMKLAVKLLCDQTMRKKLSTKINGLTWLISTFAYDVFNQNEESLAVSTDRIHINNLRELHNTIPRDCLDNEVVRVSALVKDLWVRASEWQNKVASLIPVSSNEASSSFGSCIKLDALVALAENEMLSKVSFHPLIRVYY